MIKSVSTALVLFAATAVNAQDTRQLDAHEHGVGQLDIAFDGNRIAMELHAPGADIVGFEYAATSREDRAKVDDAVARLARPLNLFSLPASAECGVIEASASLATEDGHEEHKQEGHNHAEHEGEDHADHDKEGHSDEDHAGQDDAHDHAEKAGHAEFHAEYLLECADPAQATLITFAYFDAFPNALELEVQVISDGGATAFEVEREAPTLDLRELF